jgi:formylmethanofuran dehydrogenase subunit E
MRRIIMNMLVAVVALYVLVASTFPQASEEADQSPDGYYPEWLAKAPHAPQFKVRDTDNKYGRYANQLKTITLKDLIKFHGHFCGGLVEGATALRAAFDLLFPDGVIDRTDLRIASKVSACGGDVGAYLTGARTRYGSYLLDKELGPSEYVVQQVSTGRTVRVSINAAMYPTKVREQMKKIQSGKSTPADIDLFQRLQWDYARRLANRPAAESVDIIDGKDYVWQSPPCRDFGERTDNNYKNIPPSSGLGEK